MPILAFAGASENNLPASSNEESVWLVFKCSSRCSVFLPYQGLCNNYQEGAGRRTRGGHHANSQLMEGGVRYKLTFLRKVAGVVSNFVVSKLT